ncbi:MAG: hypothetical protein ACKERG_00225 [Candidatus Hodgkinia cicadicola]
MSTTGLFLPKTGRRQTLFLLSSVLILNGLTPPAPYGGEGEEGKPRTPQFHTTSLPAFLTSPSASCCGRLV